MQMHRLLTRNLHCRFAVNPSQVSVTKSKSPLLYVIAFVEIIRKLCANFLIVSDFRTRPIEVKTLNLLQQKNCGDGYCAAWFMRRFLRPVIVSGEPTAHKGMGLDW